jgi:serine/threonine-protein kinase
MDSNAMNVPFRVNFLAALRKSKLVSADQLNAAIEAAGKKEPRLSRYLVKEGFLTKFQASRLRTGVTGFFLGNYVVLDFVGKGRNSVVYKARHLHLPNRLVALKTIMLGGLHKARKDERLRQELSIVSQLDHPNIVRVYDVVVRNSFIFLVLDYVEGSDLAQLVTQFGPLPVADAAGYVLQAARALSYVHGFNTLLRDIEPANLILARDGTVKLAGPEFTSFPSRRSGSEGIGSPEFVSPEQVESPECVDRRSDLYSLGASLFYLLTGEPPEKGNLGTDKPQSLVVARPDVPAGLAQVGDRLLAKHPEQRPNNAEEVITALSPFARECAKGIDARHWDGHRKAALVLDVLKGKIDATQACTQYSLPAEELERWKRRFLEAGAQALDSGPGTQSAQQEIIRALHAKIGAQAIQLERFNAHAESIM